VPEQGVGNMPGAPPEPAGGNPFAPSGPGPFTPADSDNPYQPPSQYVDPTAAARVSGPAIALIITAALGIVMTVLGLVWNLFIVALVPAGHGMGHHADDPTMMMFSGASGIVSGIVGILMAVAVIAGAIKMKKLENYGMAMAAAIIAMIPCNCCCVLGLPFGIWALVVLNDANVKAAFRS
jgi:hypothetical protein